MKRVFLQQHQALDIDFKQSKDDFIVDEIASREFKNRGNFLILHVKKTDLPTWDMLERLSESLNIPLNQIGYAGLKDKYATTSQYISIPLKYERNLKKFHNNKIEILNTFRDKQKINIGDLKANRFTVKLHNIDHMTAGKIEKYARKIEKLGMPNYFGYQRFSKDSITQAQQMIDADIFIKDGKIKRFLIGVYQSKLFNEWLCERVEMAKESGEFLLLSGDVMINSDDKLFTPKTPSVKDFKERKIAPTGLLVGRDVFRARGDARVIEKRYDDELFQEKGHRRRAWIYPQNLTCKYKKDSSVFELSFILPKASYATVFIENIANKNFA